jgi:spermidine synthase
VAGDILSVYPLDGDWSRLRRDYWWQALAAVRLPRRASALLVGLGGGTQVHLLRALARPRMITVIERDPVIMRAAMEWFGLGPLGPLECYCSDAALVAHTLLRARRRFGFVMEDTAYAAPLDESRALVRTLADLVAPGGMLVVNRHYRGDGARLAAMLRPLFARVWQKRVRREGENVLVCCHGRVGF